MNAQQASSSTDAEYRQRVLIRNYSRVNMPTRLLILIMRSTIPHRELPAGQRWPALFVEVGLRLASRLFTGPQADLRHLGRKLKCDGRSTCANCNRRGLPCAYVPVYVLQRVSDAASETHIMFIFPFQCCSEVSFL